MPSTPSTLAISCGSQIAVVTPCGSTQRSNSSGVISDDSTCRWVSMKPGTMILPETSISRVAAILGLRADDAVVADRDVAAS